MVTVACFWVRYGEYPLLLYWAAGSSNKAGLLFVVAMVLLLVLLVFFGIRQSRAERKRWLLRGQVFDGGAGAMRHGRVVGRFRGREAALFSSGGGKHGPSYFNAQLACSSPLRFEIYPHATITIGKPKNAFESGDAALNREFGFTSDDSGRFLAWFQRPENKQQVVAMLHRGSQRCRLELTKGQLVWGIRGGLANEADLPPAQTDSPLGRFVPVRADPSTAEELERTEVREILESLTQLASALESGT
jgi:hypothetical protein